MKALFLLFSAAFGFFDVKSLYEKYEYYNNHSDFMQSTLVGLQPIARLTAAATSSIAKDSPLLKVPSSDILTTFDTYAWSELFKNETPEIKASAMLIHYKVDNSSSLQRTNYANQFNSDIEPPGYWLEEDLKIWLAKFIEYPHRVRVNFPGYDRFKELMTKVDGLRSLAYEVKSYGWAQAITRTHGIEITEKEWKILRGIEGEGNEKIKGYAFVPLFELYNQHLMPDVHHPVGKYPVKFENGFFTLSAQRDFKVGEETYVPYKAKNNHQLIEDYGYSIPYNTHEYMEIEVSGFSELCDQKSDNGCKFFLGTTSLNQKFLEFFRNEKNPLRSYRKGIRGAILDFKFAVRHQRRRVKILEDRHLRMIMNLSISEKWTAYKALALADRQLLKNLMSLVRLA